MSVLDEINKNPLEFINKLSRRVVYDLVDKQINKKEIDVEKKEIKKVYNVESLFELLNKKYYYPTMNENEYIELNKDMYYIILFKIIDIYDLELLTVKMLQKMSNINAMNSEEINKIKLETMNEDKCSYIYSFYKTYDPINKKEYEKNIKITT